MTTKEELRFYADTDQEKNKLFVWRIRSIVDLPARIKYFASKFEIKAAWYVVHEDSKMISNQRIDMIGWYNSHPDDRECHFLSEDDLRSS